MNRSADRRLWIRRVGRASLMTGVLLFGLIGVQGVLAGGESTNTDLESSENPATFTDTITFTATVTDTDNDANIPTGMVEFFDGSYRRSGRGPSTSPAVATLDVATSHRWHPLDHRGLPRAMPTSSQFLERPVAGDRQRADDDRAVERPHAAVYGESVTLSVDVSSAGGTPTGTRRLPGRTTSTLSARQRWTVGKASVTVSTSRRRLAPHHGHLQRRHVLRTPAATPSTRSSTRPTRRRGHNDLSAHTDAGTALQRRGDVRPVLPGGGVPRVLSRSDRTGTDMPVTLPAATGPARC